MYRALLLVCLLGLAAGQCNPRRTRSVRSGGWPFHSGSGSGSGSASGSSNRWPFGQRNGGNSIGNSIETATAAIARKLIDADRKMDDFCTGHSDRPLREVYGVEHYQLRVTLNEFSEEDIQVVVRHRLVVVHAQNCPDEYAAVRILPDMVDARRAGWQLERNVLTVLFPYNLAQNSEIQSRCGRGVSEDVIIVPKTAVDTHFDPDHELFFGDGIRKAFLQDQAELAKNKDNQGAHDDGNTDYIDVSRNGKREGTQNSNVDYKDDYERVVLRTSK